jgi:hypothetical protein
MATCPCGSSEEHQAYMRGRRETRERLGYSGFDDGGHPDPYGSVPTSAGGPGPDWLEVPALGMPTRRIPASPADDELLRIREECQCGAHQALRLQRATASEVASQGYCLPPDAVCKGCRVPESSPIGAGPFENGLCRFCADLNAYEPIAAAPRHQDLVSQFAGPQLRSLREPRRSLTLTQVSWVFVTVMLVCIAVTYFMMVT